MTTYPQPPRTMSELLAPFPAEIVATARALRATIKSVLPRATEAFYGGTSVGIALYTHDESGRVACGIQPAMTHCKLYVHGVRATDLPEVRLEGAGKTSRHVQVPSVKEAKSLPIRIVIEMAAKAVGVRP